MMETSRMMSGTPMPTPIELAELLASRLVHELVGPIGGVSNGVELLGELAEADAETVDLLSDSAGRASKKLQFYRLAYGHAGRTKASLDMLKAVVDGYLEKSSVSSLWSIEQEAPVLALPGIGKCLLLAVEISAASLLRGGRLLVSADHSEITVTAHGPQATLRSEVGSVLSAGRTHNDVSANTVHAAYLQYLVTELGGRFLIETEANSVVIRIVFPS